METIALDSGAGAYSKVIFCPFLSR
jgi:hypothetical protein